MAPAPEERNQLNTLGASGSDGRTGNEEPLVNGAINRCRGDILSGWDFGELRLVDAICRALVGNIGQADVTTLLLASNKTFPSIAAFADDLLGVLLVLAFTTEGELVLGLAIRDLVDAEPLIGCTEETRKMTFDVFDVVQLGGKGIVDLFSIRSALFTNCCSRSHSRR